MATTKKATTKKSASVKGLPQRMKVGDKYYTKKVCGKSKADAKKSANAHRSKGTGKLARVKQDPKTKKWCVYTRG